MSSDIRHSIRVRFKRGDDIKYVSHLDIMRLITRLISRAEIKVWHTEGFNPHPYLVFAPPLPMGYKADDEVLDIVLEESFEEKGMIERFNKASVGGLEFTHAYIASQKLANIKFARYLLTLNWDEANKTVEDIFEKGSLLTEKKGKSGFKTVDVLENSVINSIYNKDGHFIIDIILPAEMGGLYTSPELLITAIESAINIKTNKFDGKRLHFLDGDMHIFK